MKFIRTAKQFVEHLVEHHMWDTILKSRRNGTYPRNGTIGQYTINLNPEETKLLSQLKSDDLQNVRWPRY